MDNKKKRQSMILYVIIAIAAIVALNSVVYPSIERATVSDVSYSEFIDMVDADKVDEVSLDTSSGKITFTAKGDSNTTYRTNEWPSDDSLAERLNKHGVTHRPRSPTRAPASGPTCCWSTACPYCSPSPAASGSTAA